MIKQKLFLASSSELKEDRDQFDIFIGHKNKDWVGKGVFLELNLWEDFLDAVSQTRLQDEYNRAIAECHIFVMLFWTKVGQYTAEEFERAFMQFKATNKPFIFTYFKDAPISTASANRNDLTSLWAFQDKLKALGHFQTVYTNTDGLLLHFSQQLDKLVANGFIEFKPDNGQAAAGTTYNASLTGDGAIAQGGGKALGARAVYIGGNNAGKINTGTQIDTGGGTYVGGNVTAGGDFVGSDKITYGISPAELEALFAPLLAACGQHAPASVQAAAMQQVQELKAEVAKDKNADDTRLGKIVQALTNMVPGAIGSVVSMFATPILGGIVGQVTKSVLSGLEGH